MMSVRDPDFLNVTLALSTDKLTSHCLNLEAHSTNIPT
jgi:hypothetical protein